MTKCAICGKRKCVDSSTKHLLATFDCTFDGEGLHSAGLVGGALYAVSEIGALLNTIQGARVAEWKSRGAKGTPPRWIAARSDLTAYFSALGDDGFDLTEYESLQEAAGYIANSTAQHGQRVRELLESLSDDVGWSGITSSDEDDIPLASSSYALWWDDDAEGLAKSMGQHIATILKAT